MSGMKSLLALILGLVLGGLILNFGSADMIEGAKLFKLPGELWLNMLKLGLIPLIFSLVASSACSALTQMGRDSVLRTTLLLIFSFLALSAIFGAAATMAWLATGLIPAGSVPFDPVAKHPDVPGLLDLLKALIPSNIVAAASDGALAPISIFALLFGMFVARTSEKSGTGLAQVLEQFSATMLAMVEWVLIAAPLAVFCFGVMLSLNLGTQAASFVGQYISAMAVVSGGMIALAYLGAYISSRQKGAPFTFGQFVKAALPAQALALSTQSSLATLPLMIKQTTDHLAGPPELTRGSLSLAVALFRFTAPGASVAGALLVAHFHGLTISPVQLMFAIPVAVIATLSSAGVPGMATVFATKSIVMSALGLPFDLLPILVALDTIPDMIKTVANVTADMALTTMVANGASQTRQG
jgi:proton glutamate symport protein